MTPVDELADQAADYFRDLQRRICEGLEILDGSGRFSEESWTREGGGGGLTRVLGEGAIFEKAGVNFSDVRGELPEEIAREVPGEGRSFRACGVSLVLHPRSPMVPTVHANVRFLAKGVAGWFGGGADLTPYYPWREDVIHFHQTWKTCCDRHDPAFYPRFKRQCDEYFYLPHRDETRGVGGIFFDYLKDDLPRIFAFVRDVGDSFLGAYGPIVQRRRGEPWGEAERAFQLHRRGRYVEFNLLYDRGTIFGLKTRGRIESILMSLPPIVRWPYDPSFPAGTREAELAQYLKPTEWLD
jgi:coproporphyrinogen III oxidase